MKHGRQSVILEIISKQDIETQGQLMQALAERGIKSTQATLSRDIKDMRLVKELGPSGSYRYVAPTAQDRDDLGIKSTQATLSRDIKDMRLVKELGPSGSYRYVAPTAQDRDDLSPRLKTIFRESLVSYDIAQNIIVIKTLPGLASACCSAVDNMIIDGVVGTLAGDDTAFIAMRDNDAAHRFFHEIELLF